MPRQTAGRETANEANVAHRVALERERRGWSYDALAKRMTDAGCTIQPSALFKVEKAGRRITVEELVALSRVFGVTIDNLLTPVDLLQDKAMKAAYDGYVAAFTDLATAFGAFCVATATVANLATNEHEFTDYFVNRSDANRPQDAAVEQVALTLRDGGLSIDRASARQVVEAISACKDASFSVALTQIVEGFGK